MQKQFDILCNHLEKIMNDTVKVNKIHNLLLCNFYNKVKKNRQNEKGGNIICRYDGKKAVKSSRNSHDTLICFRKTCKQMKTSSWG